MKWHKIGRIFTPQYHRRWWLDDYAQAPATLLLEDRVRVYFSGRPPRGADGNFVSYTGFAEFERGDLTRLIRVSDEPILPLGDLGCFDEHGVYPASVIRVASGETRCYYAGWSRRQSVRFDTAIGLAVSRDGGETFEREWPGPLLGACRDEPFILSGPKIRCYNQWWYLFYIAGREWKAMGGRTEPVYKIRMATSPDGVDWAREGRDLIPDSLQWNDEVQSGPDVFWADAKWNMLFCFRPVGNLGGLRIGYASSTDLLHWTRDDARAGITVSDDPAAWDSNGVRYPHRLALDGEEYLFYNGNDFGRNGFGLARRVG